MAQGCSTAPERRPGRIMPAISGPGFSCRPAPCVRTRGRPPFPSTRRNVDRQELHPQVGPRPRHGAHDHEEERRVEAAAPPSCMVRTELHPIPRAVLRRLQQHDEVMVVHPGGAGPIPYLLELAGVEPAPAELRRHVHKLDARAQDMHPLQQSQQDQHYRERKRPQHHESDLVEVEQAGHPLRRQGEAHLGANHPAERLHRGGACEYQLTPVRFHASAPHASSLPPLTVQAEAFHAGQPGVMSQRTSDVKNTFAPRKYHGCANRA